MPKKETTINDLAVMVQKGFIGVDKKITDVASKMARKVDMEEGFKGINKRLDRIERVLLSEHEQRIERLEDDVKWLRGQLTLGAN